jgi:glycosyltransferase involved in cell wall biosynthesis
VTVCVPVRNGARTIGRTLDSILAQDYSNFEIIVSDNCSTDETAKIVHDYAEHGIRYYFNPKLEACGESNWNHILSLAEGPLIALYHADDLYMPPMLRKQVEFLTVNPDVSAVFTMTKRINENDHPIRMGAMNLPKELQGQSRFNFSEYLNALLKHGTFTPVPTMMTRREVLDKVGNFCWQKFISASDVDLYLRMARQWGPIGVIDEPLHCYRISSWQGTAVINKGRISLPDFHTVIDAHLDDHEEKQAVKPQSLAFYEMYRAADEALCAQNLLVLGKVSEARERLRIALTLRHFLPAFNHPETMVRLLAGLVLLIGINLRLGTFVGRQMSCVHKCVKAWRRKPIKQN